MARPSHRLVRAAALCVALALAAAAADAQAPTPDDYRNAAASAAHAGDLPRAIALATAWLQAVEQQFGPDSAETAEAAAQLGLYDKYARRYEQAARLYARQIAILERLPDQGGRAYVTALSNLGLLHLADGHPEQAEAPLRHALERGQREMASDPDLAFLYNDVALMLTATDRRAEAVPLFETALEIRLGATDMDPGLLAVSHDNVGNAYLALGRYEDAEPELEMALKLFRANNGDADSDTLICLVNLADLHVRTGRGVQASALLSEGIAAGDRAGGDDGEGVLATVLRRRAALERSAAQLLAAESDLNRALVIAERHRDVDTLERSLVELGELYEQVADHERANEAFERAQALQAQRPDAPRALASRLRAQRTGVALHLGDFALARQLAQASLDDDVGLHGAESAQAAVALNNLAGVQLRAGDVAGARANVDRAIAINTRLAPTGEDLMANLSLSGAIAEQAGDAARAESDYRRALQVVAGAPDASAARIDVVQVNLELLLAAQGRSADVLQVEAAHAPVFDKELREVLAFGDEQQGLALVRARNPFSVLATIGAADPLARAVLNDKGAVTDASLARRARTAAARSPEQATALENWRRARSDLTRLEMRHADASFALGPEPVGAATTAPAERDRAVAALRTAQAEMLRVGAQADTGPSLDLSPADVTRALPPGSALVDFVRYSRTLGRQRYEDSYGALVYTPAAPVRWIPLGAANETERLIEVLRPTIDGRDTVNTLLPLLREFHDRLVRPLLPALPPDTRRLLISTDGDLNDISFATLVDERGRFLAERFGITYITSARAILPRTSASPDKRVAIYADPAFRLHARAPSKTLKPMPGYEWPELEPLPAARQEAVALRKVAQAHGWAIRVRTGREASEADLRATSNPGVLHLATHGFYLPESGTEMVSSVQGARPERGIGGVRAAAATAVAPVAKAPAPRPSKAKAATPAGFETSHIIMQAGDVWLLDPMLRSAVALAGAQDTLEGWRSGQVGALDDDGILNGQEAAALDLRSTWIVTLSTCDSGVGEAVPGEGILGLRRGFLQAGARNVLTTLWPVSDAVASSLMGAFYARAFDTGDAPSAFAEEQRRLLVSLRARYGVETAVRLAGAFVMTSQGLSTAARP